MIHLSKIEFLVDCFRQEESLEVKAAYSELILRMLSLHEWTCETCKKISSENFNKAVEKCEV